MAGTENKGMMEKDVLKDQSNKENRSSGKSQKRKRDKKRKTEDNPDDKALALVDSKEITPAEKRDKKKVENCPHVDKNEDTSFMCSTCRIICCEDCLREYHEGHKWCELVPYIPSEEEEDNDHHEEVAKESSEEEVQINTNGRRRLKGGFVNTRKPRSRKNKTCSCHGCKHDPKHLKRIVPIDESRFKPSNLLAIENAPSDISVNKTEEGSGKKKKKKKKKGKIITNSQNNSGDEEKKEMEDKVIDKESIEEIDDNLQENLVSEMSLSEKANIVIPCEENGVNLETMETQSVSANEKVVENQNNSIQPKFDLPTYEGSNVNTETMETETRSTNDKVFENQDNSISPKFDLPTYERNNVNMETVETQTRSTNDKVVKNQDNSISPKFDLPIYERNNVNMETIETQTRSTNDKVVKNQDNSIQPEPDFPAYEENRVNMETIQIQTRSADDKVIENQDNLIPFNPDVPVYDENCVNMGTIETQSVSANDKVVEIQNNSIQHKFDLPTYEANNVNTETIEIQTRNTNDKAVESQDNSIQPDVLKNEHLADQAVESDATKTKILNNSSDSDSQTSKSEDNLFTEIMTTESQEDLEEKMFQLTGTRLEGFEFLVQDEHTKVAKLDLRSNFDKLFPATSATSLGDELKDKLGNIEDSDDEREFQKVLLRRIKEQALANKRPKPKRAPPRSGRRVTEERPGVYNIHLDENVSALKTPKQGKKSKKDVETLLKNLPIDPNCRAYLEEVVSKTKPRNRSDSPSEALTAFTKKVLNEDSGDIQVTDELIEDLCHFMKRREDKQIQERLKAEKRFEKEKKRGEKKKEKKKEKRKEKVIERGKTKKENERTKASHETSKKKEVTNNKSSSAQSNPVKIPKKDIKIQEEKKEVILDHMVEVEEEEEDLENERFELISPPGLNKISDFLELDSVTEKEFYEAIRVGLKEKLGDSNQMLWKEELQAKIQTYNAGDAYFAKSVRMWLKLPIDERLYSVYDGWRSVGEKNPKRLIECLAPTERERFAKQLKNLFKRYYDSERLKLARTSDFDDPSTLEVKWKQRCVSAECGIKQIKERFYKAYKLNLLHIDDEKLITEFEKMEEEELGSIKQCSEYSPLLVNGHVKFGDFTEEIEYTLDLLKIDRGDIEILDVQIMKRIFDIDVSKNALMKKVVLKGNILSMILENPVEADPLECLREVDSEMMKSSELWKTAITTEKKRLIERNLIYDYTLNLTSCVSKLLAQICENTKKEIMQIMHEAKLVFPFFEASPPLKHHPIPEDAYALCPVMNSLVWIHKTGENVNTLMNESGKVIRELEFGTSIEDFTYHGGMLLASDPVEYRILSVVNNCVVVEYLTFDNLMPLGIQTTGNNLLVCFTEQYYKYDASLDTRRFVARLTPKGKILQVIEWKSKTERWFTVPRRVVQSQNGDICVIDRYRFDRGRILMFNGDGSWKHQWSGQSAVCNKPFDPRDIEYDRKGRLFVADYSNNFVLLFETDYERLKIICHDTSARGLCFPQCLALTQRNQLWVGCKFGKVLLFNGFSNPKIYEVK